MLDCLNDEGGFVSSIAIREVLELIFDDLPRVVTDQIDNRLVTHAEEVEFHDQAILSA